MSSAEITRVLYMDDDAGLSRLFEKKMDKFGYRIALARNGQEGLALFKEGEFDILVVDYKMPGLDGLQVIEKLKEAGTLPPIIMLTGAGNEEIAAEAMKMGASDYIVKDINGNYFQLLPLVIDEAVNRYRLAAERRLMQRKLEAYAAELERSNRELQQFAYVVSHDLKEPLHTIMGFAKFLTENYQGNLDMQADECLQYITEGTVRMERLINGLLDYSRVKFNRTSLGRVNCNRLLEQVIHDLKSVITRRNAVITQDSLPTVTGDERLLRRLFQNLIDNALKYCRDRRPEVHVAAELRGEDWLFSIRDNGIGIDPKYAEKIFLIFQRLHSAREFGGDGLGLAICQKIVESHKGKIWVESQAQNGSTFYFTIPVNSGA